jgi:RNA polymerase sigma-70 factor (ECF subfamily)
VRNLLEELVPRIYRFALRLTHDPHAAEDLTQDTVLRAWRGKSRLRNPHAARVWLFRITVNLWRDQLRRGRSRIAQAETLPDNQPGQTPAPDRQVAEQDEVRRALAALDRLPERQRNVLYLNACEGLAAAEIAAILGVHYDSVKASLCVARKKLREELRDLFEDLFPAR